MNGLYGSTGCRVFKQGIFIYAVYFKILLRKKSEVSKLCGFVTTIIWKLFRLFLYLGIVIGSNGLKREAYIFDVIKPLSL